MGDRYYNQMLNKLGTAPGFKGKRKKRMAWTDEKREEVIAAYEAANPTPENSMEIVAELAEEYEESPNGVRMILSKAGVYIKKEAVAKKGTGKATGGGGTRVSKAAAHEALNAAIRDLGQEPDDEIVSKLTGKAAQYFTTVLESVKT